MFIDVKSKINKLVTNENYSKFRWDHSSKSEWWVRQAICSHFILLSFVIDLATMEYNVFCFLKFAKSESQIVCSGYFLLNLILNHQLEKSLSRWYKKKLNRLEVRVNEKVQADRAWSEDDGWRLDRRQFCSKSSKVYQENLVENLE